MNQVPITHAVYQCPRSDSALLAQDHELLSVTGGQRYEVKRDVPTFLHYEPMEGEATRQKLERLNNRAAEVGWRAALDEVYPDDPGMVRYVTDDRRLEFLRLLPIASDDRVLEIGPGLGQFTAALAEQAGEVYGLEIVQGQAEFALQRARQMGRENVSVACGGDDCILPYQDEAFDGVVLNLVLEWCGGRCETRPLAESQTLMLREIARVLKPGGFLYLATKNRYALHYLLGKRDEHAWGIRFGNALPRPLMRWLCRRAGHPRSGGYLHSFNALSKLLQSAGFDHLQPYWAAPEMRYPERYIPLDAPSVRAARRKADFREGAFRSTQMLMPWVPAPCVKHVTHGLVFLATKNGGDPNSS